jgi:hypothetical protein
VLSIWCLINTNIPWHICLLVICNKHKRHINLYKYSIFNNLDQLLLCSYKNELILRKYVLPSLKVITWKFESGSMRWQSQKSLKLKGSHSNMGWRCGTIYKLQLAFCIHVALYMKIICWKNFQWDAWSIRRI